MPAKAPVEGVAGFAVTVVQAAKPGKAQKSDKTPAADDLGDNCFPPPDHAILLQLSQARTWMEQGHYSEVIECLEKILNMPEDCLFPTERTGSLYPALKDTAERMIGEMPREGRQLYQMLYGHEAQNLLEEALANGDAAKLAGVAGRFFHTQAGYEATFLLGLYHLDHGWPLEAARKLQKLRAVSGAPNRFEPALTLAMAAGFLESGDPKGSEEARSCALGPEAAAANAGDHHRRTADFLVREGRGRPDLADPVGRPAAGSPSGRGGPLADGSWRPGSQCRQCRRRPDVQPLLAHPDLWRPGRSGRRRGEPRPVAAVV